MKFKKFKFIDLFCGIGGFHQVFKDHDCVLACDIDKNCRIVYKDNYNIEPHKNVRNLEEKDIPEFDILCAGFPCQSFSNAGKKLGLKCKVKGTLFDEIIRISNIRKPKFMFLENVKHIMKIDNGNAFKYILEKLDKNNYHVQTFTLSPHNYGIPQQRERVFFICIRKDIYNKEEIKLKYKENKVIHLKNFLEKKPDKKYKISGDILKILNTWNEMIKKFKENEKISPTILIDEYYKNHDFNSSEFKNLANWRQDYIIKNQPLYDKYKKDFDKWYNKNKEIITKNKIFSKLEWQVGKIKKNDSIFEYFIQIRQSGIRVKKSKYFPTLVAISQIPIYGKKKRYITPRECLNIQSFPSTFKMSPNDKITYKQAGNSINVMNATNIIESTLNHYGYELKNNKSKTKKNIVNTI